MPKTLTILDSTLAAIEAALPIDPQPYTIGDRPTGLIVVDVVNGFCTVGYGCAAPTEPKEQIETMVTESNRLAKTFTNRGLPVLAFLDTHEPGKPEREHVSFANLRQHPEGCGYTNEARFSGLKLLKPALAGFVCVATPCAGVGYSR